MQTRKTLLLIHVLFVYWKKQNFKVIGNFLPFESLKVYGKVTVFDEIG